MNSVFNASRIIPGMTVSEGAGVTVNRTIGTPGLRNYDPFMLLDHFGSDNPDDYIAGFPSHPHRGFSTFTYMLDGYVEHKDSMGNTGNLGPGGAQLMKAASGIIHSEMPKQENGLMRGFQLWINLPAKHKMDTPEYQEYASDDLLVLKTPDYSVKVLMGQFENAVSPIEDDITNATYFDVQVNPGKSFRHRFAEDHNSILYVFEGDVRVRDKKVSLNTLLTLVPGDRDSAWVAGEHGARIIVISGRPIGEPIVQYGPFVMNTREEVDEAMRDFQSNNFVRDRAWVRRNAQVDSNRQGAR